MNRPVFLDMAGHLAQLFFLGLLAFFFSFVRLAQPLLSESESWVYYVKPGASLRVVSEDLFAMGVIGNAWWWQVLVWWRGEARSIQSGEYDVMASQSAMRLLARLVKGDVKTYKVSLIPGMRFLEIRQAFQKANRLMVMMQDVRDSEVMSYLADVNVNSPEGYFYPDTYVYRWGEKDSRILKQAHRRLESFLLSEWLSRADHLPYQTPYEALVAASLLVKESAKKSEYPLISGVLINRFRKKMPLQIDASQVYWLKQEGRFSGRVLFRHLKENNPYNTYRQRGLPPTPIGLVSPEALHAVLHPERHDYFYYVADGLGGHLFSKTWGIHKKRAASYRAKVHRS